MSSSASAGPSRSPDAIRRVGSDDLQAWRSTRPGLVILAARHRAGLAAEPQGLVDAVPVWLDADPPRLPGLDRHTPVLVYCHCAAQTSSTRVARWLLDAGLTDVWVLEGGWPAWRRTGGPVAPLARAADDGRFGTWRAPPPTTGTAIAGAAWLQGTSLPARRDLAVLFVDLVGSTHLVATQTPEAVLAVIQTFTRICVDSAVSRCGDVHDFEGDGALLYFPEVADALATARAIRRAMQRRRGLPPVRAAIDHGPLVIGRVGGRERHTLCFVGPVVNTAARLLKQGPPGGIVITRAARDALPEALARPLRRHPLTSWPRQGFAEPVDACVT